MKKGDIRKQKILDTAEMLFCRNGYEQTSIQDILNQLHCSKGSFYHHFISKETLLEEICKKRAKQIYDTVSSLSVSSSAGIPERLNTVLSGMIPLRDEKLSFLLMLLPIFRLPEGRSVRITYCDALSAQFIPVVSHLLSIGHHSEELICHEPDLTAGLILSVVNRLWITICTLILSSEDNSLETDLSELIRLTDCYSLAIERIISVPYGSLKLIDIPSLCSLSEQIHSHWKSRKYQI